MDLSQWEIIFDEYWRNIVVKTQENRFELSKYFTSICYRNFTLASAGIIGQHVAVQEHPQLAGQTQKPPAMKTQNTYTIDHHVTAKGTVQVSKDLNPCLQDTAYPLTLDSPDIEDSPWITQKLR